MAYARATDGTRLHYEVVGRRSGQPVLFIQGLGASKHGWDLQRLAFAPSYRVIAHDNRGAGRSDKPFGSYSLEQMADDAVSVLDHAGIESAHVVGASMGGAITQFLAIKYPERVRSVTLACTACRNHQWRRELIGEWADVAARSGMGDMTRIAARWVIGPRSFRRAWPAMGWLGPLATTRPAHGFIAQARAILAADDTMAERLSELTAPTLVIVGNQDILTPRGDSEELADRIATAELVVLSGAAHGLMVEHATTFNSVVGDFLGRASRAWDARHGHGAADAETDAAAS
jgi:3-oxoadipate enol-lactonase